MPLTDAFDNTPPPAITLAAQNGGAFDNTAPGSQALPAQNGGAFDNTPPSSQTVALGAAFDNTPPTIANDGSLTFQANVNTVSRTNVNIAVTMVGLTISGRVVADGDLILLVGQTNGAENGFWLAHVGSVSTRAAVMDTQAEANANISALVQNGTEAGKVFILMTPPPINLGVTLLNYQEKSALSKVF